MTDRYYSKKQIQPPQIAVEGAKAIQDYALKLFNRADGAAVDWPMMAESPFKMAFHIFDNIV